MVTRGTLRRAIGWTLTLLIAAGWFLFFRPTGLDGPAGYVTVAGESMEPTFYSGDFVITRQEADYEVGDVLVYRIAEGDVGAGGLVIHRIVDGSIEEGFVTQGDNRDKPDLWYPTGHEIVGKVWIDIPKLGRWLPVLRNPFVMAAFAAILAFVYVMTYDRKSSDTAQFQDTPGLTTEAELSGV